MTGNPANDFFGARYYGETMGRFMRPDNGSAQDSSNPQSWNLYSYVMNNPTTKHRSRTVTIVCHINP